ncbi:MAG: 4a-hydroxytetrahydrobiopterin dehydratase [Pseudomonadales bacterium]|nr:4a-hydroxytetrahydrobiopterin dehydratase [Pseudomonadales bacterium]NRA18448.1 4a-hydroxytetrahydrobiopterin dehydratase [Oceanospirillaceae bacterium]
MEALSKQNCSACDASANLLSTSGIAALMPKVSGWELLEQEGIKKLSRKFPTGKYSQSVAFTNAVAELAQSVNHHPQIVLEYASVTVIWWSHNIQGLHKNDFIMAAKTSELF